MKKSLNSGLDLGGPAILNIKKIRRARFSTQTRAFGLAFLHFYLFFNVLKKKRQNRRYVNCLFLNFLRIREWYFYLKTHFQPIVNPNFDQNTPYTLINSYITSNNKTKIKKKQNQTKTKKNSYAQIYHLRQ
jgi:hypothetical protein